MPRQKIPRLLIVFALLAAAPLIAGKKPQLPAGVAKAATISAMLQYAVVHRPSQPVLKARYGMDLTWNDSVQTDGNGRVRVRMIDDSLLSIGANSELRITSHDSQSRKTRVELAYGLLRAQIKKLAAGEEFEVRTPTAVAGVIGTDFGIDATDPQHVKFICLQGRVQIRSLDPSNPGTVNCEGGHRVTIDQGKTPNQPEDADTAQMSRWRRITDPDQPDY